MSGIIILSSIAGKVRFESIFVLVIFAPVKVVSGLPSNDLVLEQDLRQCQVVTDATVRRRILIVFDMFSFVAAS